MLGKGMLKGAELAASQLNEHDGILGRQVEIVPIDDTADPETGVKAARRRLPIRLTSDQSTNGLGFTLQPMTYQIAPVASQALTEWLDAKRVAIAYDPTQNYTVSVSKALRESLEEAGVSVTAYTERSRPSASPTTPPTTPASSRPPG